MPSYNLAKFRADQPNLWAPLVLPSFQLACEASAACRPDDGASTFEVSLFTPPAEEPTTEVWKLVHAADAKAAELGKLAPAAREDLLHVAAACVITAILRARSDVRVARVSRRGPWLDFHLENLDGGDAGVLAAFGTAEADTARALVDAAKHVEGAPGSRKIAGAVAFGGGKAAIRVLS